MVDFIYVYGLDEEGELRDTVQTVDGRQPTDCAPCFERISNVRYL